MPLRLHHVGVVVTDLPAATAFFVGLGLAVEGEAAVGGASVDSVIGGSVVQSDIVMFVTPDGHGRVDCRGSARRSRPPARGRRLPILSAFAIFRSRSTSRGQGQPSARLGAELIGDIHNYEGIYLLC